MFYSLSWDWRRDIWEQAERLKNRLEYVYQTTQCRPIVVAHSYGGRLAYATLGRYGEEAAQYMAGVVYAAAALQPNTGIAPGAYLHWIFSTTFALTAPGSHWDIQVTLLITER